MVTYYSKLLHQTWLGAAMSGGVPWLWPLFEVLHFFGMALLIGCVLIVDLRTLGLARGLPLRPLRALAPWGMLGFTITLITGVGFYAGFPGQYMSWAFLFKMLWIVLAGINLLAFHVAGLHRLVDRVGPGHDAPRSAKVFAAASLFFWLGVIFWGRMLQVFSDTF